MGGEEILHTVAGIGGAEGAGGADQDRRPSPVVNWAWTCSQLSWMYFHAWSRFSSIMKGNGELDGRVLVADLVGDGVVEGALNQGGVFELGEQAERTLLQLGIG